MDTSIVTHILPNLPLSTMATRAPYEAARCAEAMTKTPLSPWHSGNLTHRPLH